jgi:hypothetical protein
MTFIHFTSRCFSPFNRKPFLATQYLIRAALGMELIFAGQISQKFVVPQNVFREARATDGEV